MTTYRIYANTTNANDFISAVFGDAGTPLTINSTGTIYQNPLGSNFAHTVNANIFGLVPALQYDSWLTIGAAPETGMEASSNLNSIGMYPALDAFAAGQSLNVNHNNGGSWYILFPDAEGYAGADLKVLIAQITTNGSLYGALNMQVFVNGIQANSQVATGLPFSSDPGAVFGCMNPDATNYNPLANTDTGNCVFPCALTLSADAINPTSCATSTNGSVTVVQSGAQFGVHFGINLTAGAIPMQNLGTFSNLPGGVHTIYALDGAGCTQTLQVTVPSPVPVALTAALNDPITCNGENDAVIVGVASGGTGAFSYSLAGPVAVGPQTSGMFSNLGAGLYTVTAVDANGCAITGPSISVHNPATLNLFLINSAAATLCNSPDGMAVVTPVGGSGAPSSMQYSTDGVNFAPDGVPGDTGTLFLAPGEYMIYVQDVNGCIGQLASPVVISGPPTVILDIETQHVSCFGAQDGQLVWEALGGIGALTVHLNGEEMLPSGSIGSLGPGEYVVVASDEAGCVQSQTVLVVEPTPLVMGLETQAMQCGPDGLLPGTVWIQPSGGTPPYLYAVNEAAVSGTSWSTDLPGTYAVAVTDANGCITSQAVTFAVPSGLGDWDGDGVCNADEVFGCTIPVACNYDESATEENGSCTFYCPGCTDESACNFDSGAIQEDGSCVYPLDVYGVDFVDCSGACLNDNDGDGVCDPQEVAGCMDELACNFNPAATDQLIPCVYAEPFRDCAGSCMHDEDGDGLCDEEDFCPIDPLNDADADGVCADAEVFGCTDGSSCSFNLQATEDDASCLYPVDVCGSLFMNCDCVCYADADGDGVCDEEEIPGCSIPQACNYAAAATDPGPCDFTTCAGCTYAFACNYNPAATLNNGTCVFGSCSGCTSPGACNFNPTVSQDDGSCVFPNPCGECSSPYPAYTTCAGECLNDSDADGVCDEIEQPGCTHDSACNYSPTATDDDGSCLFASGCAYCMGVSLVSGDSDADGVCDADEVSGCQSATACNYNSTATDPGPCVYATGCDACSGQTDGTGFVIDLDANDDGICDGAGASGCTYPSACNYSPAVAADDGSCVFPPMGMDCSGMCVADMNQNGVCDALELTYLEELEAFLTAGEFCGPGSSWNPDLNLCIVDVCPADLNGDGWVGSADLLDFLSQFGVPCTP
jgi:hypothetical protein